jgi:hypothetical protein
MRASRGWRFRSGCQDTLKKGDPVAVENHLDLFFRIPTALQDWFQLLKISYCVEIFGRLFSAKAPVKV